MIYLYNGIYTALKMNQLQLHAKWMNLKNNGEQRGKSIKYKHSMIPLHKVQKQAKLRIYFLIQSRQ